eukprot:1137998-Pelagomonas_calceolata.AAC.2
MQQRPESPAHLRQGWLISSSLGAHEMLKNYNTQPLANGRSKSLSYNKTRPASPPCLHSNSDNTEKENDHCKDNNAEGMTAPNDQGGLTLAVIPIAATPRVVAG